MSEDGLTVVRPRVLDILHETQAKPALSTDSDRPVVEAAPEPEKPVEAAEAKPDEGAKTDEDKAEELAKKLEDGELPDDLSVGVKRALTRQRNRRKTAEAALAAANEQVRQALAIAEHAKRFIPNEQDAPEPKIENYDVSTDQGIKTYVAHAAEWLANQKDKARQEERVARTQQEAAKQVQGTYMERLVDAEYRFPGILDVGTGRDQSVPINEAMAAAIMLSEKAPEVLNYLKQHTAEAKTIYGQPPARAAAMIGRIEAELAQPKAPQVSKAAKPMTPVGGGNEVPKNKYDPNLPSEEYWRIIDAERAEKLKSAGGATKH